MRKEVYDAYEIYRDLIKRNPALENLTEKEKEAYTFITRDKKFMSILDSFPKGTEPSLLDIVPRYNKLCDEEAETKQETKQETTEIKPDVIQPIDQEFVEKQTKAKTKTLSRVNQVGYANIVLMSIIVMIIVAIICVFIFM